MRGGNEACEPDMSDLEIYFKLAQGLHPYAFTQAQTHPFPTTKSVTGLLDARDDVVTTLLKSVCVLCHLLSLVPALAIKSHHHSNSSSRVHYGSLNR